MSFKVKKSFFGFLREMQTTTRLYRQFCIVTKPNNMVTRSLTLFSRARRNYSTDQQIKPQTEEFVDFKANKPENLTKFFKDLEIYPNFITEVEHDQLVAESEKALKKKKYQNSHFDHVITGYRETEKSNWSPECLATINRVKSMFAKETQWLYGVHVLDLEKNGYIGPHVDSIKFSGNILSGLCLMSSCIMTLKNEKTGTIVDLLLKPRALYIMRDDVRFDYSHEIHNGIKQWRDQTVERERRISIMFRNEVEHQQQGATNQYTLSGVLK